MTQEHPIAPPPELVREWQIKIEYCSKRADREAAVAKVFQLGADMELDACCEWLSVPCPSYGRELRNARRPKPPSLKEQALKELKDWTNEKHGPGGEVLLCEGLSVAIIREALESLPE